MLLIPVMELKSGRSVHTERTEEGKKIISEDPLQTIAPWVEAGCKRIHVVDVDAVISKHPVNAHLIAKIHKEHPDLDIQVGGISREEDILIWLDAGVKHMIMNSRAIHQPNFIVDMCVEYPGSIMVALDSHSGVVRFKGHKTEHSLIDLVKEFDDEGVEGIVLTDIPDQGHVNSCNITASCELASQVEVPIYANGGVSNLADLEILQQAYVGQLAGIIVGRPLHNHQLDFQKAQDMIAEL
ncbi:MAG: 1-(5-phosphoribosyl)-5-((5-phosphoribosylamino)methylideneamino)imidazole-4-carboxamide isomerase [Enterobacterales bacterium]|nr:1-(5-phosphoribosyl)-5-((5-phosphoribosylamino)methylideneamino)imidazole-4-carboxamide isomerase [Enterobacterales bacterium]